MNGIIGIIAMAMSFLTFGIPILPPKDDVERIIRMWKLSALFLIAAAISFHG